jgi:hypothetical protein
MKKSDLLRALQTEIQNHNLWVTSIEKATPFSVAREAQAVKGQREDTSGVLKDKDECYFYVMRIASLKQVQKAGRHGRKPAGTQETIAPQENPKDRK